MKKTDYKKYTAFNILLSLLFVFAAILASKMDNILGWVPVTLMIVGAVFFISFIVVRGDVIYKAVKGRSVKFSTSAITYAFVIFLILWAVNFIVYDNNKEFDFTQSGRFTISEQTVRILNSLENDIEIISFFENEHKAAEFQVSDLIERYRMHTRRINFRKINPINDPFTAQKHNITSSGTILFKYNDNEKKITEISELAFTNAIKEVAFGDKKVAYFIQGHGERKITGDGQDDISYAVHMLEQENYKVEELFLLQTGEIPEDASVVIIAGAEKKYEEFEIAALDNYIKNGGKVIVLIDPTKQHFDEFLREYNLLPQNNIVIDQNPLAKFIGTNYVMPIVTAYSPHEITEGFELALVLNWAMPVTPGYDVEKQYSAKILAQTGEGSWGESDIERLFTEGKAQFNPEEDLNGPLTIAAISERKLVSETETETENEDENSVYSRILVIGNSAFISNSMVNTQGNLDFFLNCVNFMAGFEDFIAIRPKKVVRELFQPTENQIVFFQWLSLVIVPLIPLLIYFGIYLKRKIDNNSN
ncbi:MAG: Gldg family protein [Candidatus Muiribacteriota bacterium]